MQHYAIQSFSVEFNRIRRPAMANEIIMRVAHAFNVTVDDMKSPKRHRRIAYARFAAYKLIRDRRGLSYARIAALLGRSDHATAISGIDRAGTLLERDPEFAAAYKQARG